MRTTKDTMREQNPVPGTLADESREAVGRLLRRSNRRNSGGTKKNENSQQQSELSSMPSGLKGKEKQDVDSGAKSVTLEAEGAGATPMEDKVDRGSFSETITDNREEMSDSDWEDGYIPTLDSADNQEVTIEFNETPDSAKRKPVRRATAQDKELAENIHKVHLLCLLGRGRMIDRACDDPLIQAALLSLLPRHLLNIIKVAKLTAKDLHPLILWFQDNFHVRSPANENKSFRSALAFALETREGTSEEIAALSVALFRALSLTTRFVSILDVASLKPNGDKSDNLGPDARRSIFSTSIPMVARQNEVFLSPGKSFSPDERDNAGETSQRVSSRGEDYVSRNTQQKDLSTASGSKGKQSFRNAQQKDSSTASELKDKQPCPLKPCRTEKSQGPKRKGDIEFELQMEMALSATAVKDDKLGSTTNNSGSDLSNLSSPLKRARRILSEDSSTSYGVSTAIGSRRVGSPLYWAEVFCDGENLTGKWVHVDAVNAIIDGEQKVEAVADACKTSLRYVVAFAGNGAKDVTRRYCMKWYKIASKRVNPIWWDATLAPLRELESRATSGMFHFENDNIDASFSHDSSKGVSNTLNAQNSPNKASLVETSGSEASKVRSKKTAAESSSRNPLIATRSSVEDMELETRALTEPLPTNQQAYRNHPLYAIEKWLTKYQVLRPRGPILGFCSGHAVYPRTCVQTLKTKERWLREALQVKANELPIKELKRPTKPPKVKSLEDDDYDASSSEATIKLYGKWQLEPLKLPHAVNGIVPKNERGQVDVWSEKCLPPGTVHLRLPRVFNIAKRMEIDYAPAMVGFEFKNGQSYPVFEGIVVCSEFKDVILEAYIEEQERREAEEKKRNEVQAITRWYQLLSTIVTRQRLNNRYGEGSSSFASTGKPTLNDNSTTRVSGGEDNREGTKIQKGNRSGENKSNAPSAELEGDHVHMFVTEDRCSDDEDFVPTKRCHCGLIVQAEDL